MAKKDFLSSLQTSEDEFDIENENFEVSGVNQKFDQSLSLHGSSKDRDLDTFRYTTDGIHDMVRQKTNYNLAHKTAYSDNLLRKCELKDKFLSSVEDKTGNECKRLLSTYSLAKIMFMLVPVLEAALYCGSSEVVKIIHLYMIDKSLEIVKKFRTAYVHTFETSKEANVWLGMECFCNRSDEIRYENKLCNRPRPLIIVEADEELIGINVHHFHSFEIRQILASSSRRNESSVVADRQLPASKSRLAKVPKSVAKDLFKKHSNLTMVCPSAFKSTGFETKEHKVLERDCIRVVCRMKGIIPIGEHHFPLKINGFQTDVLEGISNYTSAVHIGDRMVNSKGEFGTLGGFVKFYGIDTFLTCAHVIFGKSNISNLQTKDIHFNCHTMESDCRIDPVKCTLIHHILKYDTEESPMEEDDTKPSGWEEESSIDAALVLIQIPNTCHVFFDNCSADCSNASTTATSFRFLRRLCPIYNDEVELRIKLDGYGNCTQKQESALGLKSMYLNENYVKTEVKDIRAIALSAISGKQDTLISVNKEKKLSVIVPGGHVRMNTNIMYNQLVIYNMDFKEGDSGTCIYTNYTPSGDQGCLGMLIGKCTTKDYIVTPMKEILKALNIKT